MVAVGAWEKPALCKTKFMVDLGWEIIREGVGTLEAAMNKMVH